MSQVIAITPAARQPDAVVIRVDGRAIATLSARSVSDLGVKTGMAWNDRLAQAVRKAAAEDRAVWDAMRRLNRRPLSESQLTARLGRAGHEPVAIAAAVRRLKEVDLIDDAALARRMVDEVLSRSPAGLPLLRQKLQRSGFCEPLVQDVLTEVQTSGRLSADDAADLARQKLRTLQGQPPAVQRRRIASLLHRRGFDQETVESVLESVVPMDDEEVGMEW